MLESDLKMYNANHFADSLNLCRADNASIRNVIYISVCD